MKRSLLALSLIMTSSIFAVQISQVIEKNKTKQKYSAIYFSDNNTINLVSRDGDTVFVTSYNVNTGRKIGKLFQFEAGNPNYRHIKTVANTRLPGVPMAIERQANEAILYSLQRTPFLERLIKTLQKSVYVPANAKIFDASLSPDRSRVAIFYQDTTTKKMPFKIYILK